MHAMHLPRCFSPGLGACLGVWLVACSSSSPHSSSQDGGDGAVPDANIPITDAASPSCGAFPHDYTSGNGSVTYYTFSGAGSAVNCGFSVIGTNPDTVAWVSTGNGQWFGAMNTADYDNAAACGACVEVTRDGSRKVDITIVDQCPTASNPKCTAGHIDLSEQAFLQIGSSSEGYLGTGNGGPTGVISWKYVPCPVTKDVDFEIKPASTQYYAPVLVEGYRYPITSLEAKVGGKWMAATRQSYNYWLVGSGALGPGPFDLRAIDINGSAVEATVPLDPGVDQSSNAQFPLCH
jgi:expansin (peptidoglycan-binding protein)